jgi:excisionase family DNA binding protein
MSATGAGAERILSAKEAADRLGRSAPTIRRWCHQGRLEYMKFGDRNAHITIKESVIDAFIEANTRHGRPSPRARRVSAQTETAA